MYFVNTHPFKPAVIKPLLYRAMLSLQLYFPWN